MTTETLMTDAGANTSEAAPQATASEAPAGAAAATEQQAPAAQDAAATTGETGADANAEQSQAKPEGAPEKYDFKAPEGAIALDTEVLAAYGEVARELNLTQEAAQKVIDKIAPVMEARQSARLQSISQEWAEQSRTDAEFGGDKLTGSLASAKKALDTFGTPALRTLLQNSGLGNHPEVIRAFAKAGDAISEDKVAGGKPTAGDNRNDARALYPNSNMA